MSNLSGIMSLEILECDWPGAPLLNYSCLLEIMFFADKGSGVSGVAAAALLASTDWTVGTPLSPCCFVTDHAPWRDQLK